MQDPMVQSIIAKGDQATTNRGLLEAVLLIQDFLEGDDAMLNDPDQAEALSHLRQKSEDVDETERQYLNNKSGFIDGIFDDAEKIKLTGNAASKARAEAGSIYRTALANKRADYNNKMLKLKHEIEHGPKVTIHVAGHYEGRKANGVAVQKLCPDIINIMGVSYPLAPGVHEVPRRIAEEYERVMRDRAESEERKALMIVNDAGDGVEAGKLIAGTAAINRKYQTSSVIPA